MTIRKSHKIPGKVFRKELSLIIKNDFMTW